MSYSSHVADDDDAGGVLEAPCGLRFACLDVPEAELLYEEIFVRRAYEQFGVVLRAGDVVIDAGANIGLFALRVLGAAPGITVHAFEPVPRTAAVCRANLAVAGPYAIVHEAALGAAAAPGATAVFTVFGGAPGEATRHASEAAAMHAVCGLVAARPVVGTVRARLTSVAEFLADTGIARVDLLKVDVEGDELDVLRGVGGEENWSRLRQVAVEVHDVGGRLAAVVGLLEAHGFRVVASLLRTSTVRGYTWVVPSKLCLYYVYAVRPAGGAE
jgi:FkbM family methyltransferase